MQLHGKVVSPNRSGLNLNGSPELLINIKSGRITLNNMVVNKLGAEGLAIGFGYDPEQEQGSKAFMYVTEDGCSVGKGGAVSNKWHSTELHAAFKGEEGMTPETTRFKLDIDMEKTIDYEGVKLYPIAFQTALANLTRTKKAPVVEEPVVADNSTDITSFEEGVLPCPAHHTDFDPLGQEYAEEPYERAEEQTDTLG